MVSPSCVRFFDHAVEGDEKLTTCPLLLSCKYPIVAGPFLTQLSLRMRRALLVFGLRALDTPPRAVSTPVRSLAQGVCQIKPTCEVPTAFLT